MQQFQKIRPKQTLSPIKKFIAVSFAGFLLFSLGWSAGSGRLQWSLPLGDHLQSQNTTLPSRLNYSSVQEVYDALRQNFDGELSEEALLNGLKNGLAGAANDPYTEYLPPDEAKAFNDDLNGTFSGIGAELGKRDESIVIVAPISGFPAEKAGLRAQDIITEINGESSFGLTLSEAVQKIRGEVGTEVRLTIVRDGKELEFNIIRENITIPSVEFSIKNDNVGYIKVARFADDTAELVQEAARQFSAKDISNIVLDVRSNPGGLLEESVDVASIWLPAGKTILQEKRGGEVIKTYRAGGDTLLEGTSTVVLIDEGSASASEIVAGALQDNGAAVILGTQSFGKGSVQSLVQIPGGGVLKVTIARWYTPNGNNIDKSGITPEKKVERTAEDVGKGRDPQLDAALKSF